MRLEGLLVDLAEPLVAVDQLHARLSRPGALDGVPDEVIDVGVRHLRSAHYRTLAVVRLLEHHQRHG